MVIKPPTMGPATGPMNVAPANMQTATPLSIGFQKSARAPPTMASGAVGEVSAKLHISSFTLPT